LEEISHRVGLIVIDTLVKVKQTAHRVPILNGPCVGYRFYTNTFRNIPFIQHHVAMRMR